MTKGRIIKILEGLKNDVYYRYKVRIRGVFGSYARKEAKKNSDIDILVDFDKKADLFDLVDLSLFLEKKLRTKVDIVPRDSLRKEIRQSVLKEAIYI